MVGAYVAITVLLLAAGFAVTHAGALTRWDDHVNAWFAARRTPQANDLSRYATHLANTAGIVVVGIVVSGVAWLRLRGRRALLLVLGLPLELATFLTVNYTVRRPRPAVRHLGSTPSTFSWPSGHVAATFVLYGGIALLVAMATRRLLARAAAWLVAAALTTGVAWSRVYRGEHHLTDVVAGVLLGVGALAAATLAVRAAAPEETYATDVREPVGVDR